MFDFLFGGLTAKPERGAALFDAVTRIARRPDWYLEGDVPDTLDGRFRVLATVAALAIMRLEQAGNEGLSVALTERFVSVMESEHLELGIGDPALGKKVRLLVGSLARRVALWRAAVAGERGWDEATRDSLKAEGAGNGERLRALWERLQMLTAEQLAEGAIA